MMNNSACTPTVTAQNMSTIISFVNHFNTTTCTQSTNAICSSSQLATVFAKGIASGSVVAAYCNVQFLVIVSNGMPNHVTDSLVIVPHPPGLQLF
jgi:hypothetical protein